MTDEPSLPRASAKTRKTSKAPSVHGLFFKSFPYSLSTRRGHPEPTS
jgi:hypothetical protein